MLEFVEFPAFTKRLDVLAGKYADEVLSAIQNDLVQNPERGSVMQETGGVRKARVADPIRGKGKRGGFRYPYYYIERDWQIFLLMRFSKDAQADFTKEQKKTLKRSLLK